MLFKDFYRSEVIPLLIREFGYRSIMEVPKIEKVTLNMGVGRAATDKKIIDQALNDLSRISGQKAIATTARKSIAAFKIREGYPIGCKVTLRKSRMFDFLERMLVVCLPRIRDFRGLNPKSFDGRGNYNLGVKEQIIFPEIEYDKIDSVRGLNITITTTAKSDNEALALLKAFKFPFRS